MSFSEKLPDRKFPARISAPSENMLLAAIAICFLILHILAATILVPVRQRDVAASPEPARLSSGD